MSQSNKASADKEKEVDDVKVEEKREEGIVLSDVNSIVDSYNVMPDAYNTAKWSVVITEKSGFMCAKLKKVLVSGGVLEVSGDVEKVIGELLKVYFGKPIKKSRECVVYENRK